MNNCKLQQLHDRLDLERSRLVNTDDLRDLVATMLSEEQPAITGETPIGNGDGKVLHLSEDARRKLNLPASSGPAKGRTEAELLDGIAKLSVDLAKAHARIAELEKAEPETFAQLGAAVFASHPAKPTADEQGKGREVTGREFYVVLDREANVVGAYNLNDKILLPPGLTKRIAVLDPVKP